MESTLSINSRVRLSDDVVFQDLHGMGVVLNLSTHSYLRLNAIGTRIWELLENRQPLGEVLRALLREYDVHEDRCRRDLLDVIREMAVRGLLVVT